MILWRNTENYPFLSFDSDPRFPPILLYVRWKSGVTFVRRCFRDVSHFGFKGGNLVLIVPVPVPAHCLLVILSCLNSGTALVRTQSPLCVLEKSQN